MTVLLALAYPLLVFLTLTLWDFRVLGALILSLGFLRGLMCLRERRQATGRQASWWMSAVLIGIGIGILWTELSSVAKLYPVIINFGLLGWFGRTLIRPPSAIERLARLTEPDLPDYAVNYTRRVTWIWCGFFLVNGLAALYTSVFSSFEIWTLYNGLIAYLLMGTLFALEYLVRRRVRAGQDASLD